jgi:DNA-binding transcriptional MerR regulator
MKKKNREKSYSLEEVKQKLKSKGIEFKAKKNIEEMRKAELREEIKILEKLLELNMKDLWDIVEQRDKYYYKYQELKSKSKSA